MQPFNSPEIGAISLFYLFFFFFLNFSTNFDLQKNCENRVLVSSTFNFSYCYSLYLYSSAFIVNKLNWHIIINWNPCFIWVYFVFIWRAFQFWAPIQVMALCSRSWPCVQPHVPWSTSGLCSFTELPCALMDLVVLRGWSAILWTIAHMGFVQCFSHN